MVSIDQNEGQSMAGSGLPQLYPYASSHYTSSTRAESLDGTDISDGPARLIAEPIAIVGIGCRLPGGASNVPKLRQMLLQSRSGQCKVPSSRFNIEGFYHPDKERHGTVHMEGGYFLEEDIRAFDNKFFNINSLEATFMDPQQRQLLEVVYEAFENAGISLETLSGSNTGCYVGNFVFDFELLQNKETELLGRYSATGMGIPILANKLSYIFNLQGPSYVLDTACSSSVYALHVACSALRAGECDSAVAAGVNLIQSPEQHIGTAKAGVLSGTSTCHTFDTSADGYGRAEGVNAVFLKRYADAVRDGDPIRAVIRGTAVNANGRTKGITLPSARGQEAVIRKAYAQAGLPLCDTDYVECHGTGTPVGDPIEVDAVANAFRTDLGRKVYIGSVKTNLGHSEAASGISSVIKNCIALEEKTLLPTIGVNNINPNILGKNVEIVTQPIPWVTRGVHRASINSFGYGGANAHVVLEAAPDTSSLEVRPAELSLRNKFLLPISAASEWSLRTIADNLVSWLPEHCSLPDLAYTLAYRRSSLSTRGFLIADRSSSKAEIDIGSLRLSSSESHKLPYAFVFTGQGAQWAGMCRQLIAEFPSFAKTVHDLDLYLSDIPYRPVWKLADVLCDTSDPDRISLPIHSQPACTALQIALVQLLKLWGASPTICVGHSSGEICAAYAAGHITAREAIIVAYYRGLAVSEIDSDGAMIAAGLSCESAEQEIRDAGLEGHVCVACSNSPKSVSISGDRCAIESLQSILVKRGIFARLLKTGNKAYHSHHMKKVGKYYEDLMHQAFILRDDIKRHGEKPRSAQMISSVTGDSIITAATRTPAYWRQNLESRVQFTDAMRTALSKEHYHYLELGPHSALQQLLRDSFEAFSASTEQSKLAYTPTLTRNKDSAKALLQLAGALYLDGAPIPFAVVNGESSVHAQSRTRRVLRDLPTYPWHHDGTPLWSESSTHRDFRNREKAPHDLLGYRVPGSNGSTALWRSYLSPRSLPWLKDHKLGQTPVLPAAGYLSMAVEALLQYSSSSLESDTLSLRSVNLSRSLAFKDWESTVEVLTELRPHRLSQAANSGRWWDFEITSRDNDIFTSHVTGQIGYRSGHIMLEGYAKSSESSFRAEHTTPEWYSALAAKGLVYGPTFQGLHSIAHNISQKEVAVLASLRSRPTHKMPHESRYAIHPATLDSVLQATLISETRGNISDIRPKIPVAIENLELDVLRLLKESPSEFWTVATACELHGIYSSINSAQVLQDNVALVHLRGLRALSYEAEGQRVTEINRMPMLEIKWKPDVCYINPENQAAFSQYIATEYQKRDTNGVHDPEPSFIARAIEHVAHHRGPVNVLQLIDESFVQDDSLSNKLMPQAGVSHVNAFYQAQCELNGTIIDSSTVLVDLATQVGKPEKIAASLRFDAIVLPRVLPSLDLPLVKDFGLANEHQGTICRELAAPLETSISNLLSPGGFLVCAKTAYEPVVTSSSKWQTVCLESPNEDHIVTLSQPLVNRDKIVEYAASRKFIILYKDEISDVEHEIASFLSHRFNINIRFVALKDIAATPVDRSTAIISTVEFGRPMLSSMTESELGSLKYITNTASLIFWLTGGDLFTTSANPEHSLVLGLSRTMTFEQPSSRFLVYAVESATPRATTLSNISTLLSLEMSGGQTEAEFMEHNGLVYTSRVLPADRLNEEFVARQEPQRTLKKSLSEAGRVRLAIRTRGQVDSICFEEVGKSESELERNMVEVKVKCVGMNAKDTYAITSRLDTQNGTCSMECTGMVTRIGRGVSTLKAGDRVIVMAPGHFGSHEIVPEWACAKLHGYESFDTMSTLPLVFSTALYALHDKAQIEAGETVLIHSAAGGLGQAAIQIAQLAGAEVFATVATEAKKEFLMTEFDIPADHIFSSRESGFLKGIMQATSGKGVDVILNSLTGDLLHEGLEALAEFGRFIELGRRDIVNGGRLDMHVFKRDTTFVACDLSRLYNTYNPKKNRVWSKLLRQTLSLYRKRKIRPILPLQVFDCSEVVSAFRSFQLQTRIGKIAVMFDNPASVIEVIPQSYRTTFCPGSTYLLIGCLGGLGRSLSKWMFDQGARNFVFLGRSGTSKPAAKKLVDELEDKGCSVTVVRGDVSVQSDVERAVAAIRGRLAGVVQAAMGLSEALFSNMSLEAWNTAIKPKVDGTWHLHNAIKDRERELDFFLMTSSISGSVGTATESNYCSANAFLDSFARYRRRRGLRASSLGLGMISQVGYLHENPEIEQLLLRKGLHPIKEREMISLVDLSIASQTDADLAAAKTAYLGEAHLLTGMESTGLQSQREQGFEGHSALYDEPRMLYLAKSRLDVVSATADKPGTQTGGVQQRVADALASGDPGRVKETVGQVVTQKLSNLLLLPEDKLKPAARLGDFGMDSMLAAEFRTFVYHALEADVPFQVLLNQGTTIAEVVDLAVACALPPN